VAVVAVGETPYSEGFGDVGGPEWAYDPADKGVPREEKSLELQLQDRETVQRVCTQVQTCVVLVVSGRPQIVTDLLGNVDALVASWLPGTEGAGVADVLFGDYNPTGKLPMTWMQSVSQQPINDGDGQTPLFPYGFVLSYPQGKQKTTGFRYEPWHFRFVGSAVAADLHAHPGLTLEEWFRAAPDRGLSGDCSDCPLASSRGACDGVPGVSAEGMCDASVLTWCFDGTLTEVDCTTSGLACQADAASGGANCL